jgi:hypothetical protein
MLAPPPLNSPKPAGDFEPYLGLDYGDALGADRLRRDRCTLVKKTIFRHECEVKDGLRFCRLFISSG